MKRGSIYATAKEVEASLDPNFSIPNAARLVHWRTRLRVILTRRYQSYTPLSHAKYIKYQILEVAPIEGASRWVGYIEAFGADPDFGAKPKDNICKSRRHAFFWRLVT